MAFKQKMKEPGLKKRKLNKYAGMFWLSLDKIKDLQAKRGDFQEGFDEITVKGILMF